MSEQPASSSPEHTAEPNQLVKFLLEIGPLIVFALVNWQADIFWGTGAFMAATVAVLVVSRSLFGRLPIMPLVTGVFVVAFGGLTLVLQDELFIKMKPTIVNALFAAILFTGLLFGRSLLRPLFDAAFRLREPGWRILTLRWAWFFLFLALLNEVVWRSFSTSFWINFKLFGIIPLVMIFAIAQVGLLKRYEDRSGAQAAE